MESNVPSRQTRRENARPRKLDAGNMSWEEEIKAMKDKMDLMMNVMK